MHTITPENLRNADRHLRNADRQLFEDWRDRISWRQLRNELASETIPSSLKNAALLNLSEDQVFAGYQAALPATSFRENEEKLQRQHQHAAIWAGLTRIHHKLDMPSSCTGDAFDPDATAKLLETYPHRQSARKLLQGVSETLAARERLESIIPESWEKEPRCELGADSVIHKYRERLESWHIHFGVSENFEHDRIKALSLLPLPYVTIYFDDSILRAIFRVRAVNAKEAQGFRREIQPLLTPFGIMPNKTKTMAKDRTIQFQPNSLLFFDPNATLVAPADRILPDLPRHPCLPSPRPPRSSRPPCAFRPLDMDPYDCLPRE